MDPTGETPAEAQVERLDPGRMRTIGLALLALTIVGGLLFFELAVRLFWDDPDAGDGKELIVRPSEIPELEYELLPGAKGAAWGTDVRVNSHGMRGPEVQKQKGEQFRVAVIGDSVAFGNLLPEEAVFPYRLQAVLDAEPRAFEVLNFAVGGYDIVQEVTQVERRVVDFEPDLVVLAFSMNDAWVSSINSAYLARVQAEQKNPLFASHLYRFVMSQFGRASLARDIGEVNSPEVFKQRYRDHIDPIGADEQPLRQLMASVPPGNLVWYHDDFRIGRIRHSLGKLAEIALREGFEVAVMVVPYMVWEDGVYRFRMIHEILKGEVERAGFTFLDPLEEFLQHTTAELRAKPGDPAHPNELGHGILAERLRAHLLGQAHR
jgi:lysophospholipase L1-like esterase